MSCLHGGSLKITQSRFKKNINNTLLQGIALGILAGVIQNTADSPDLFLVDSVDNILFAGYTLPFLRRFHSLLCADYTPFFSKVILPFLGFSSFFWQVLLPFLQVSLPFFFEGKTPFFPQVILPFKTTFYFLFLKLSSFCCCFTPFFEVFTPLFLEHTNFFSKVIHPFLQVMLPLFPGFTPFSSLID